MPFDFHHADRLKKQIGQLSELRYQPVCSIDSFCAYHDKGENGVRLPDPSEPPFQLNLGDHWKGWDQYLWLCTELDIPEACQGKELVGIFDFGITGAGNNSHFESLIFVNDEPYQGVDSNHQEVFFPPELTKKPLSLRFRLWSGLNGGGPHTVIEHQLRRADIAILDRPTDEFYFMTRNMLETIEELPDNDPTQGFLKNTLLAAFRMVDFSYPRSEDFYASTKRANDYLNQTLQGQDKPNINVSLIGHTHIDVAWLWRYRHTREKCARSFSTVNRLMKQYENYQFLQSQAQVYDFIRQDYPDIYSQIKELVQAGRWEPSGSMWVECDCNLSGGESIVRQILYGKRFFEREFGYENDFLWLPDVFGYSWALPQILKKSGIDTFVTTKISWNDTNKLPYDTFYWRGIDGTEVTTHFITAPERFNSRYYTYNGKTDPYSVKGVWDAYQNKDTNTDLLIAYGYGDGGGGVNRDMLETMRCVAKMPGLPHVRSEHVRDYLKRLNHTMAENPRGGYIPTWDGELYLEFHRGTYTSQAYNKKTNRRMEFAMRNAELLAVLANNQEASTALYPAWKIILRNQFHDVIPGSSIHEVYEDSREEYAQAEQMIKTINDQSLNGITKPEDGALTVFNTSSWKQSEVITQNGKQVLVQDLPPFTARTIGDEEWSAPDVVALPNQGKVETEFYQILWDENGHLTSIYDRSAGRELLQKGTAGNVFQLFEDKPREFDAWELEASFADKMDCVTDLRDISIEQDAFATTVHFVWKYKNTTITQNMKLYSFSRRIDFQTEIDWQEREKILKVSFPLDIRATSARFDIQFGSIERPITRNTSWEAAKFEVVGHKWADLSESGYGVALLNDCKYGYDVKDSVLRLSLLKASNFPDYDADRGLQTVTYSLFPHEEAWFESDLEREAWTLNNPMLKLPGTWNAPTSFLSFDRDGICVDAVKKAEDSDSIVLRVHECSGKRGQVNGTFNLPYSAWQECDLMERPCGESQTGSLSFTIKPFEIKTFLLHP